MSIEDIDRGWKRIRRELELADESFVTVGVHEDAGIAEGQLTVAQVMAFHEFGTADIPRRAVIAPTMDEKRAEHNDTIDDLYYRGILAGKLSTRRSLGLLGQAVQDDLRGAIQETRPEWPPLSPATIARKGSTKPLVDTGQMLNSIRFKTHVGVLGG